MDLVTLGTFFSVTCMQAPNFASGKNRINSELRKYFNTYQPKNKAVANYNLTHFGNLDRAIYNYMVLVRRQTQTASISKQIANAANFNALNKIEASGNLSQEIKTQIQAKRLELFGKYLSQNLKNVTNLNAYEANLRKRYNASTMGTYRNGFNKRLGNIENVRRNRILAKANPLPNANVNYLRNRNLAGKNSNRPAIKFRVKSALMERANLSENNKRFLMKHFQNNEDVIAKLAGKISERIPSANITSSPEATENERKANEAANKEAANKAAANKAAANKAAANKAAANKAAAEKAAANKAAANKAAANERKAKEAASKFRSSVYAVRATQRRLPVIPEENLESHSLNKPLTRGASLIKATEANKERRKAQIRNLKEQIRMLNGQIPQIPNTKYRNQQKKKRDKLQKQLNQVPKNNLN